MVQISSLPLWNERDFISNIIFSEGFPLASVYIMFMKKNDGVVKF